MNAARLCTNTPGIGAVSSLSNVIVFGHEN